jgi:metallo-beta-lactamase class B
MGGVALLGQSQGDTAEVHIAAARAAAGQEHLGLFSVVCHDVAPIPKPPVIGPEPAPKDPKVRSTWHADPVKVFDNLYYVGQNDVAAWALTTSDGIILIDTIFDYAIEDEVVGGLKALGLDPAQINYAIVTHGHDDHFLGAKYLQDHFGTRIIVSQADWDLIEHTRAPSKPRRDMVATDGQTLTLGDTTVTMYVTPGHTLGTLSLVLPLKDRGVPHTAVMLGGSSYGWVGSRASQYLTAERTNKWWFDAYSAGARRLRDIAARVGADVQLGNHAIFDGSETKLPAVAARKPGDPNPYVIGRDSVQRYLTVADECAKATLLRHP